MRSVFLSSKWRAGFEIVSAFRTVPGSRTDPHSRVWGSTQSKEMQAVPSKTARSEDAVAYSHHFREDIRKFRTVLRQKLREMALMAGIAPERAREIACIREEEGPKTRFHYHFNGRQLLSVEACRTASGVGVNLYYPEDLASAGESETRTESPDH
jgi:hypothetical protein